MSWASFRSESGNFPEVGPARIGTGPNSTATSGGYDDQRDVAPSRALTSVGGRRINVKDEHGKLVPLKPGEKPDQLAKKVANAESRQEALLDEGLEESFPSSDPVSVKRIT